MRPEALPALLAETEARLAALAESADAEGLARRAAEAEATFRAHAEHLAKKRRFAATERAHRVTQAMQSLSMTGGRLEVALVPLPSPASYGLDEVEFRVATHPKQALGPLARVASGGELSRIARHPGGREDRQIPTLIFDEVTAASAARSPTPSDGCCKPGSDRQASATHLPQVARAPTPTFASARKGRRRGNMNWRSLRS